MLSPEERTEIRRLFFAEHHTVNAIATSLRLHHDTVKGAIDTASFNAKAAQHRQSLLDPFLPIVKSTIESVPNVRATRMIDILKDRGYTGGIDILRRLLRQIRDQRGAEAYFRLSTVPGEQAQCDWGHFGTLMIGKAKRRLSCFVMVLAHSRYIYAAFTFDQTLENFLRQHVLAFSAFGGVPRVILYDCLKACVIERVGRAVRFNPGLLELAGHYHFRQQPCAPRMPQHKGKVERAIGYLRTGFFPARHFKDLDDANRQLSRWLAEVANIRSWPQDRSRRVADALVDDRAHLLPLPEHAAECWHVRAVRSDKTAFVRFDLNDYSIPPELCRKPLTLMASDAAIRILDGDKVVAAHLRYYEKGMQIEAREHREQLLQQRREALPQRRRESLIQVIPAAERLLEMLADRGESLIRHLRGLYDLVEEYGITATTTAIDEAIERQTPRAESVAHLLARRHKGKKAPPQIVVDLPDHPGVRDLAVRHHSLEQYDVHSARAKPKEEDRNV